uniref:ABC transporter domain-containing protein n=1 Tax=Chromera velia CCMP2878 TaxID=1169474 RepID=A0A0G4FH92_9ALVE|eukprot:Cvel_16988.t1-p1 / transcript=Cvel_16988.t1 / gene=Cvel_16988 / organism=Chromera_velia_CCMP2878 / gene_product=Elongation factor 3, putative / transcript_product=Elongation factor 3, putative / location=Cvel_scaffold1334:29931-37475(-) / protein_length=1144 / sequence_SO=supercontig / SO=protein_coding / is_pseudo=false
MIIQQGKLSQKQRKALAAQQKQEEEEKKKKELEEEETRKAAAQKQQNLAPPQWGPGKSGGGGGGGPPSKASDTASNASLVDAVIEEISAPGVSVVLRLEKLSEVSSWLDEKPGCVDSVERVSSALLCFKYLATSWISGTRLLEAFVLPRVARVMDLLADKKPSVRNAAEQFSKTLPVLVNAYAVKEVLMPQLFKVMGGKGGWQSKCGALTLLQSICQWPAVERQVASMLPEVVPMMADLMNDAKEAVRKVAADTAVAVCMAVQNKDIEALIPTIVDCNSHFERVPEAVTKLAEVTFVQTVGAGELAITTPVLLRGLRERSTPIKRKSALIVINMAKLVDEAREVGPFLKQLLPELEKQADAVADPDCREVVESAAVHLRRIRDRAVEEEESEGRQKKKDIRSKGISLRSLIPLEKREEVAEHSLRAALTKTLDTQADHDEIMKPTFESPVVPYVCTLAATLMADHQFDLSTWSNQIFMPYFCPLIIHDKGKAGSCCKDFENRCIEEANRIFFHLTGGETEAVEEEEEGGELLCDCRFSLGYGSKILLHQTELVLRRGHRYGLCGANGVGKSTLMRSIANGQLEGFPSPEELRTEYVEHDLDSSVVEISVLDLIFQYPKLRAMGLERQEAERVLGEFGFDAEMRKQPVSALSGGWKMKLALARAMLAKADILLLDEPTNHLDTTNVAWLERYLCSLSRVTSLIVSHDSSFLDNVCTDIIHYQGKKLKNFRGNLSAFVEVKPEAKAYYDLNACSVAFKFPNPASLDGIKSKVAPVVKLSGVSFSYPAFTEAHGRPVLQDVTVRLCLNSRVGVVGPNGAGKSTLIKLVTSEQLCDSGELTRHPNLRIAYVAQHAFHHVEQHLEETPYEYIMWRYAKEEDRENMEKADRKMTEKEMRAREEQQRQLDEEMEMTAEQSEEAAKAMLEKLGCVGGGLPTSSANGEGPAKAEEEEEGEDERVGEGKGVVSLMARRKKYRSYEYQVEWVGFKQKGWPLPSWHHRNELVRWGCKKLVNEIDAKIAAESGLQGRKLDRENVTAHCEDFGLDKELTNHTFVKMLSGGQKVKLVLAAALWSNPHLIILDEPTNYLDRDSLGALAAACKEFQGGVVVISHSREFVDTVCGEIWEVGGGRVKVTGGIWGEDKKKAGKK